MKFRLLIVDNFQIRRYGKVREGAGQRFYYGAIRNDWRVMTFSERDITRYLSPLGFMRNVGARLMNRRLVEAARNFRPDMILIGNCDYVSDATLDEIHRALPGVRIAHVNVDALWQEHTCRQIAARQNSCDGIFVTTAGEPLKTWVTGKNIVAYMPNPCDPAIDGNMPPENPCYDLFFAGCCAKDDERRALLEMLVSKLEGRARLGIFGCLSRPPVRGSAYEDALAGSAMGLNANRREGWKWYSSDRIVHLMGNGICTFLSDRSGLQEFFKADAEAVFFSGAEDLLEKICYYMREKKECRTVALAGRKAYCRMFSAERVLRYLRELLFGVGYSDSYEWQQEVYGFDA